MRGRAACDSAAQARSMSAGNRAGQAGDDRPPHRAGNGAHRLEVAVRRDREAGLDDVHAQAIELLRQAQLLGRGHAEAGRLLAVAKRGVEHLNAGCGRHSWS